MDLAAGLRNSFFNRAVQPALDQQVRALRVDPDSGKIRSVSYALEPGVQFGQIKVGTQKPRNNDYTRPVTSGYAQAVINRSRVQQENLGPEKCLAPERGVCGRVPAGYWFWPRFFRETSGRAFLFLPQVCSINPGRPYQST